MLLQADKKAQFEVEIELCIAGIACGEAKALEKLYRLTKSSVYGYSLSILRNRHDAEDVLQDTYVKVFTSSDSYHPGGKPLAWILTITRNLAADKFRAYKKLAYFDEDTAEALFTDTSLEDSEDKMLLEAAMNILDYDERQIVMLHAVSGFLHREIAEFLKIPLSTVLSKYNRSIKKLKNAMEGKYDGNNRE
ncbi:hypothetical protein SDC9_146681 [bioreactor metagenome]|uniref:RNA polymerase sigma factor n=1 Tax=bioreactor metagenome TaxID=1076179 RepID=A0A645EDS2_9ZZZZ